MKAKRNSCISTNDFSLNLHYLARLQLTRPCFFNCELLKSTQNDSFLLNQKSGLKINKNINKKMKPDKVNFSFNQCADWSLTFEKTLSQWRLSFSAKTEIDAHIFIFVTVVYFKTWKLPGNNLWMVFWLFFTK